MLLDLTPREKIMRASTALQEEAPFFGYLISNLDPQADEDGKLPIKTMGVDPKGKLLFHPDFVDKLSEDELKGVLAHEVLHVAHKHIVRRGKRHRRTWNYATDICTNHILEENGFVLPECGLTDDELGEQPSEEVYATLYKEAKQNVQQKCQNPNQSGEGQGKSDSDTSGQGQSSGSPDEENEGGDGGGGQGSKPSEEGDEEDGAGGSGDDSQGSEGEDEDEGAGSGGDDDETPDEDDDEGEGSGDGEPEDGEPDDPNASHDPIDEYLEEEYGSRMDEHLEPEDGEMSDAQRRKMEKKIQDMVNEAAEFARQRGDTPAGMDNLIKEAGKSRVDWKTKLRKYVSQNKPSHWTWERPNKKSMAAGAYLPSMKYENVQAAVVADTSGSMYANEKYMSKIIGIINGVFKSRRNTEVTVVEHDAEVQKTYELSSYSDKQEADNEFKGGGGTSHIPPLNWLGENKQDIKVAVCVTDGYSRFPEKEPEYDIIWVVPEGELPPEEFPYGEVITVPVH